MQGSIFKIERVGKRGYLVSPHCVLAVADKENGRMVVTLGVGGKPVPIENMPPTFPDDEDDDDDEDNDGGVHLTGDLAPKKKTAPAIAKADVELDGDEVDYLAIFYAKNSSEPALVLSQPVNFYPRGIFLEVEEHLTLATSCEPKAEGELMSLAVSLPDALQVAERFYFLKDGETFTVISDDGEADLFIVQNGFVQHPKG